MSDAVDPPARWWDIAWMFAVALAIWGVAATQFAVYAYDTVLACDRAEDACTVTEFHLLWTDQRDRFRASDVRKVTVEGTGSDSCVVLWLAKAESVYVCEPGAGRPDYLADVVRYFADRKQPSVRAILSGDVRGYFGLAFMGALSLPFLAGVAVGLRLKLGPKKRIPPTGREGIGSRR